MDERRPRGRDELDGLLIGVVAEALSGGWASADDPAGIWNRSGSQATAERTLADLTRARNDSRRLLEGSSYDDGNEFAIGAAENRVNYVVGDAGFKYEVIPAPGVQADPALLREVQQYVDCFCELNNLPELERETLKRGDRDGEWFHRLFAADGIPEVDFVQPERIVPPGEKRAGEYASDPDYSCEWGVVREKRNRRKVVGYYVDEECDGNPVFVDESEIVHGKLNVTSEFERGWPTFEPARRALIRAEEVLVAMTATAKARAKIALITTVPGWNAAKADTLTERLTTKWQAQPNGDVPKQESVEELPYGAHVRVKDGTTIMFPPPGLGAGELVEAIQANLRTAGQRMNMPEWMFTGMADQKYSNAFVVEAPSLRMFKGLQSLVAEKMGRGRYKQRASLIWRAIRLAVRMSLLHPAVLTSVQIKVSAPSLETRDKGAEASANSTYINDGVKSRETCQEEIGLDPEREKARVQAEAKAFGLAGKRSGLMPGEEPPPDAPPAPPPEPPLPPGATTEALRILVGQWLSEGGVARAGENFPGGEHFGVTGSGEAWVSESLYPLVSEAARVGLVLKEIEYTRGGKTVKAKRWVRSDEAKAGAAKAKKDATESKAATRAKASEAARAAMKDPSKADPKELAEHLKSLSGAELRQLRSEAGATGGRTKAELADRIIGRLKDKAGNKPAAPSVPAVAKPAESPKPAATAPPTEARAFTKKEDQGAAIEYARQTHGEWGKKLTPNQTKAIGEYGGAFSYKEINGGLRGGSVPEKHAETVKQLDSAIAAAPAFDKPHTMYRGVGTGLVKQLQAGATFEDKGYGSVSSNRHTATGFASEALLEIRLPAGTKAAALDATSNKAPVPGETENEYILPRGTKYKVTGKRKDPDLGDIYTVEVVNG